MCGEFWSKGLPHTQNLGIAIRPTSYTAACCVNCCRVKVLLGPGSFFGICASSAALITHTKPKHLKNGRCLGLVKTKGFSLLLDSKLFLLSQFVMLGKTKDFEFVCTVYQQNRLKHQVQTLWLWLLHFWLYVHLATIQPLWTKHLNRISSIIKHVYHRYNCPVELCLKRTRNINQRKHIRLSLRHEAARLACTVWPKISL